MSWGTEAGVTLSIRVKEGRRRIVMGVVDGSVEESREGRAILEAESMSF